ncbi:MAG TPA: hypothetical protein VGB96_02450 [Archangium sp.]
MVTAVTSRNGSHQGLVIRPAPPSLADPPVLEPLPRETGLLKKGAKKIGEGIKNFFGGK